MKHIVIKGNEDYYKQRNHSVAEGMFPNQIDENKNVIGTKYYFNHNWCLCEHHEGTSNDQK